MTISYPLALPTTDQPADIVWGGESVVAVAQSPFTGETEVQQHDGQVWHGTVNYPPLERADAKRLIVFLQKLDGMYGTFTMSPPGSETPRGSAGGTPLVNGATQTGVDLVTDGWPVSESVLLEGDFIQLGTGLTSRLYMNLGDVTSDGSGNATLTLWPRIKTSTSPADNAAIVTSSPVGLFRLISNRNDWTVDTALHYGISFGFRSQP
jgi:hypothetical protein